jgi:hypothetical protein
MKNRIKIVILLLALALACSPNAPEMTDYKKAAKVGREVAATNLMMWVEQFTFLRANDVTVNNHGFLPKNLFPSCNLTRDASVNLVSNALKSMGYAPDMVNLGELPHVAYNIVAMWPGTSRPEEVVLVASHLDAIYTGEDDNGSAVAAMLETARIIRKYNFIRTIRFVAFDLEKFGSIGSTHYLKAGYADDVVVAIVMDRMGYASGEPGTQDDILGVELPDIGDFLLVIGNNNSIDMT